MNKKLKRSLALIPAMLVVCGAVAFARIVPGVDEPFNPAAYYSLTEISWADSPSTFALEDLAGAGGNVYDYTRHIKSILFGDNFENILSVNISETANDIINTTPFDRAVFAETSGELAKMRDGTEKIVTKVEIDEDNANLRQGTVKEWDDYSNAAYDQAAKHIWLDQTYMGVADKAKISIEEMETSLNAAATILTHTDEAQGDLQLYQAQNELKTLLAYELARKNALDANFAQMQAAYHANNYDEVVEAAYFGEISSFNVVDPYDSEMERLIREEYNYERPKLCGMPDFE